MGHQFIKGRDIVLFSFQTWESKIGFNLKDMALELSKYNRVLFINRAEDRISVLRTMLKKQDTFQSVESSKRGLVQQVQENIWVYQPKSILESINWSPFYSLYDFFNRINNKRLAKEISAAIDELHFSQVIVINDNDFFRGLYHKDLIPCDKYIFYIRDFLTIQPYFKRFGPRTEAQIIGHSDLVVANSAYLANYSRQWNSKSFDIGQGCDLESFGEEDLPVPEDMASIPRPIVGYCGFITAMRLDIEVIRHIALSLPECSVVLVGPMDEEFKQAGLDRFKNVFLLGSKAPEAVRNYIRHFDVCINPQLVNPLTIGNYPRKVDEYLAAGKPVVATGTEAMKMFEDHCFLCESKEDYTRQIRKILSDDTLFSREQILRRRNFALQHSWENSVGCLGDAFFQSAQTN
jgi:teichuronic acid biosynthesis glycosyltransferase TuaH